MRSCGVDEKYITGDASGYEKFRAFAEIMPNLIGNPMYHWCHLELRRYFGINDILNAENADSIWERANAAIKAVCFIKSLPEMGYSHYIRKFDTMQPVYIKKYIISVRKAVF
jgi:hypothetical protein